jgi:hypothetical protein
MRSSTVDSTSLGTLGRRIIKFLGLGRSDVQTAPQAAPYGIDSNPTKNMVAIYSDLGNKGAKTVIGYLNVDSVADVGELRLFSTDSDSALQFVIHLRANGTCEIGGTTDNMVRYSKLEDAFNTLKDDLNNHIQNYNAFAAAYVPGSPSALGTPPTAATSTPSTADITPAKIDEIKTLA